MKIKHRLTRKITRQRLQIFLENQATDTLVLEIGAKNSPYRSLFPRAIKSDIALTPSLDLQVDGHRLPFANCAVPVVLCIEVLEHCHSPQTVIDECYRVLHPGGRLILTTRFVFPIHDAPQDYYRFTRYGLAHLCRAFAEVSIVPELATIGTMGVLLQRLAAQAQWRLPGTRLGLQLAARASLNADWLLREEYADIGRKTSEVAILASGYYVVAVKGQ